MDQLQVVRRQAGLAGEGPRQEGMEEEQNQVTQKAISIALQGLGHVVHVARA